MERKNENLELKKSGKYYFNLCEFLFQIQSSLFFLAFAVNFYSGLSGFRIKCFLF